MVMASMFVEKRSDIESRELEKSSLEDFDRKFENANARVSATVNGKYQTFAITKHVDSIFSKTVAETFLNLFQKVVSV